MKKIHIRIERWGIHEETIEVEDDATNVEIYNEIQEIAFDIEDDIEMENDISFSEAH